MIQTERLLLRELADTDFQRVHEYASDPEVNGPCTSRYMVFELNTLAAHKDSIYLVNLVQNVRIWGKSEELRMECTHPVLTTDFYYTVLPDPLDKFCTENMTA